MHYLVTGHTGFKGAWLVLLLKNLGHEVSGLALDPFPGSLFEVADIHSDLVNDFRIDIRDKSAVLSSIQQASPDVVLHLAAQPLVRESYRDPHTTFETNVMGTLHLLEAVAQTNSVKANVVITTDKVYKNVNQEAGYVESDPLGGFDPYSSSKAMADLLTQSWVNSFPGVPTAIARAGNVIGGGDVSPDRLLVDLVKDLKQGDKTQIRYPQAVRPWQHVLDCVSGYIALADALLAGQGRGEWNFGPGVESFVSVSRVADLTQELWGVNPNWIDTSNLETLHEAGLLALDSNKALTELDWKNVLVFPESLEWTIDWEKRVHEGELARDITLGQIAEFLAASS